MKQFSRIWLVAAWMLLAAGQAFPQFTQYVNPFVGTGGHGHTYPGATMPFGMVQLSPDTRLEGWDGCSGYHYSDSIIYGFSHTHLSGTGVADYCDVLLMPTQGEWNFNNMSGTDPLTGYASAFNHADEIAQPGYYAVRLKDDNILAEMTTTLRTGIHRYTFADYDPSNIILDLRHRDPLLEGSFIRIVSDRKIEGLRRSSSWASDQWLYFAIEFSEPFQSSIVQDSSPDGLTREQEAYYGTGLHAGFRFGDLPGKQLKVKVAVSSVDCAGAWNNMATELPDFDFDATRKAANNAWEKELSKIAVSTKNKEQRITFYTALYHCMLAPNVFSDVDQRYRGMDGSTHVAKGYTHYTVFSLWDTFRALHPLLTIIDRERTNDFVHTMLHQYEQSGRLPVWELAGNETNCMIGVHSISVLADAAVKGIGDFDRELAYTAMKAATTTNDLGWREYRDKGMIESHDEGESVSKTLEYAYNDWCIGTMGALLGKDDHFQYLRRSQNWMNLFDGTFIRARFNGNWYLPFDPYEVNFNYTEANAWQYNFFAPHDLGLLLPAATPFEREQSQRRLDDLFGAAENTTGREQADITGLIGQYAHGNEPSHHIAYLYNYVDQPEKTQYYTRRICQEMYSAAPDGLSGNEDCGQMSAWYVLSSLGFYPVCPGSPVMDIGSPLFNKAIIYLENGNVFTLRTNDKQGKAGYVESAQLNDSLLAHPQLSYAAIMAGGTLSFKMQEDARSGFTGNPTVARPRYMPQPPLIMAEGMAFRDSVVVSIHSFAAEDLLLYQTHGDIPLIKPITYKEPLVFKEDVTLKAISKTPSGSAGYVSTAVLKKITHDYTVQYLTLHDPQYTAGGPTALVDGIRGPDDFRMGLWQGWWGKDMEIVVDLGGIDTISVVAAGFLQDVRSWIWLPESVAFSVSTDGQHFSESVALSHQVASDDYDSKTTLDIRWQLPAPQVVRYIKITARNRGENPLWHPGAGGQSWIFCDEVYVE